MTAKCFMTLGLRAYSIALAGCYKLFTSVFYECSLYTCVFIPGKPFQPCLTMVGKVTAYPIEALSNAPLWGWLLSLPTNFRQG
jgi:hypothetical protein